MFSMEELNLTHTLSATLTISHQSSINNRVSIQWSGELKRPQGSQQKLFSAVPAHTNPS